MKKSKIGVNVLFLRSFRRSSSAVLSGSVVSWLCDSLTATSLTALEHSWLTPLHCWSAQWLHSWSPSCHHAHPLYNNVYIYPLFICINPYIICKVKKYVTMSTVYMISTALKIHCRIQNDEKIVSIWNYWIYVKKSS